MASINVLILCAHQFLLIYITCLMTKFFILNIILVIIMVIKPTQYVKTPDQCCFLEPFLIRHTKGHGAILIYFNITVLTYICWLLYLSITKKTWHEKYFHIQWSTQVVIMFMCNYIYISISIYVNVIENYVPLDVLRVIAYHSRYKPIVFWQRSEMLLFRICSLCDG